MRERWHRRLKLALVVALALAPTMSCAPPAPVAPEHTALDTGFTELYNLRFDRAHAEFERWIQEHPESPLGPASRLSALLLEELNRLQFLRAGRGPAASPGNANSPLAAPSGNRSGSAGAVRKRPPPAPPPAADAGKRAEFRELARQTIAKAEAHLAANPRHQDALLALVIAYGSQAEYLNLVEKRAWASLPLFKKSNRYAQALLKVNLEAYDAWAASGFTEYLAASLPFYVRWFVRFDNVQADKQRGIAQLKLAAARGRYLRPFAKLLLASVCFREKQPQEAQRWLDELRAEFPANPLVTAEFARLHGRLIPGR
jgi:hypothetical protein